MFQLSKEEFKNLKSQFVISSWVGHRKLLNVFTEHGVFVLSRVLNRKQAI
ncbi:ORF6N domain-containing protein [Pedobacter glucosidilyticus]